MSDVVVLDRVSKRFGRIEAVRGVSFVLREGEAVALVGHNGAGKTTLMKMMLGLVRPSAGTVHVLGDDPGHGDFAGRVRLGFLPEHVAFNASLTGRETLTFYARLKRRNAVEVQRLLERVGIADAADRRVGGYSKGMRQRLGLAQALLGEPRLLLLDEPTTGLDPALRQSFYDIVETLRAQGVTILLASHALDELEGRTGRVIIMNRGVKLADGTLDELRSVARLKTLIRVTLDDSAHLEGLALRHGGRRMNGHAVEFFAAPDEKVELVRRLVGEGGASDIEVIPPTLDDLYVHFLREGESRP